MKSIRKSFLLSALAMAFVLSSAATARAGETAYERVIESRTLRCGYFIWPPYFNKDAVTGEYSGIYYEMIEGLGKTLGLKIDWAYEYSLGQQVEALRTGKIDALCADGPWTRSAMPYIDYTRSYMFIPGYIYVAEENAGKYTIDQLNSPDYTFTAMDGDGSADYLDMLFPQVKILSLPSTAEPSLLIENVLTGKADAMFSDPMSVQEQSAHNDRKLAALNPEAPLATYPFVISLRKGEQPLLNMLNQGLDLLNNTGYIAKVLKAHDPEGKKLLPPQQRYKTTP